MKKRKKPAKRKNPNVPVKKVLRRIAYDLWSIAVRSDWNWRCAKCGNSNCEAHHVIPRQHVATTLSLRNGISLCGWCHRLDPNMAPHQNPRGWIKWLDATYPALLRWYEETEESGAHKAFTGTVNDQYYVCEIRRLLTYVPDDHLERVSRDIVGVKFSRWLEESE